MEVDFVHLLNGKAKHNAFCDLCFYKGKLYCCFRQASTHVSPDGEICIMATSDFVNWQQVSSYKLNYCDLRDPKLSVSPDGKLTLLFYKKRFGIEEGKLSSKAIENRSCVSFSNDGLSWSSIRDLAEPNWWLWRLSWHQSNALGIAYNRSQNKVKLYAGNPHRQFECIHENLFGLDTHGKAYPNESDIIFADDGMALCLLRRDADTGSAQLGYAKPPYKQWRWIDLKYYIGGPAMLKLSDGRIIVGSRLWSKDRGPITCLSELHLDLKNSNAKLEPILELPSAGDNSYPGMVEHDGNLYIAYYSQHKERHCQVFFAKCSLN